MEIDLLETASRAAATTKVHLKKNAPTILFAAGTVGVVAGAVMASKATLKLEDVLAEAEEDSKTVIAFEREDYTITDRNRHLFMIRLRTMRKVARLYAPAFIVGGLSIAALTGSHVILKDRNSALMAAYAALDAGYKKYRGRVVEELGPEKDLEFQHGTETIIETVQDDDGEKKEIERHVVPAGMPSVYARFFDETARQWSSYPSDNQIFLNAQQSYWNDRLHVHGHVFLNEVYDGLGLDRSKEGAVVGWVLNGEGDNFIDFGVFNDDSERARAFVNRQEKSILLDFNVDGVIYDLI